MLNTGNDGFSAVHLRPVILYDLDHRVSMILMLGLDLWSDLELNLCSDVVRYVGNTREIVYLEYLCMYWLEFIESTD